MQPLLLCGGQIGGAVLRVEELLTLGIAVDRDLQGLGAEAARPHVACFNRLQLLLADPLKKMPPGLCQFLFAALESPRLWKRGQSQDAVILVPIVLRGRLAAFGDDFRAFRVRGRADFFQLDAEVPGRSVVKYHRHQSSLSNRQLA